MSQKSKSDSLRTLEEWNAIIEDWEKSGLSKHAYCQEKEIKQIVFDKNGNKYHGRVKAFADGAREGGLDF